MSCKKRQKRGGYCYIARCSVLCCVTGSLRVVLGVSVALLCHDIQGVSKISEQISTASYLPTRKNKKQHKICPKMGDFLV